MTTTTVPILADRSGPDLSGLGAEPLGYTLNPDGETYTLVMPEGWTRPGVMSRLAYSLRYTLPERIAIRASADPVIADIRDLLSMAETVDVAHPSTVAAVGYLVTVGILTEARAAEILAP